MAQAPGSNAFRSSPADAQLHRAGTAALFHPAASRVAGARSIDRVPRHLALIPDGNRRWARLKDMPVAEGHRRGFLSVAPALIGRAFDRGVEAVTLWMFSTDNWRRPAGEIEDLMSIYLQFLALVEAMAVNRGFRVRHLGRRDRLAGDLLAAIDDLEAFEPEDACNLLLLGIDYGGIDDLLARVRQLAAEPHMTAVSDTQLLARLAAGAGGAPPLDLVLRSSGEKRLSGFMPFAAASAELCFVDTYFPDLTPMDLDRAIDDYCSRERRFGG